MGGPNLFNICSMWAHGKSMGNLKVFWRLLMAHFWSQVCTAGPMWLHMGPLGSPYGVRHRRCRRRSPWGSKAATWAVKATFILGSALGASFRESWRSVSDLLRDPLLPPFLINTRASNIVPQRKGGTVLTLRVLQCFKMSLKVHVLARVLISTYDFNDFK